MREQKQLTEPIGKTLWVIPGGHIPIKSAEQEPDESYDEISLLNTSTREAKLEIFIYYADREPVGPYSLSVEAQRMRKVRFNDLIDPYPIPLDTDFAALIRSDTPIVVQFFRQYTYKQHLGMMGSMAYALPDS